MRPADGHTHNGTPYWVNEVGSGSKRRTMRLLGPTPPEPDWGAVCKEAVR